MGQLKQELAKYVSSIRKEREAEADKLTSMMLFNWTGLVEIYRQVEQWIDDLEGIVLRLKTVHGDWTEAGSLRSYSYDDTLPTAPPAIKASYSLGLLISFNDHELTVGMWTIAWLPSLTGKAYTKDAYMWSRPGESNLTTTLAVRETLLNLVKNADVISFPEDPPINEATGARGLDL